MAINRNEIAKEVTLEEGKRISVSIAQVKEVLRLGFKKLSTYENHEIIQLMNKLRKAAKCIVLALIIALSIPVVTNAELFCCNPYTYKCEDCGECPFTPSCTTTTTACPKCDECEECEECEECPTCPNCPKCPDVTCPDVTCPQPVCPEPVCPDPICNCPEIPDICPSPCDGENDISGSYNMIGAGIANGWPNVEVVLGTITIFNRGDYGFGYQCIINGTGERRGCSTYWLQKR